MDDDYSFRKELERLPRNRFFDRARVDEIGFVRILYEWISGTTFSEIPKRIENSSSEFIKFFQDARKEYPDMFALTGSFSSSISRASCHKIIDKVSDYVLASSCLDFAKMSNMGELTEPYGFGDLREYFSEIRKINNTGRSLKVRDLGLYWDPISFIEAYTSIVYQISASELDYEHLREIDAGDLETAHNPFVVFLMVDRFRRFKGYRKNAMIPHIAHYFALNYGTYLTTHDAQNLQKRDFYFAPQEQKDAYLRRVFMHATSTIMHIMALDQCYFDLRESGEGLRPAN